MSVTRYEFELYHCNGGEMLVSDTGDYVSYEDYAALEARYAALAAENAGLKELIEQHANSVAVCPNCSHEEPSETDDIVALYRSLETPAIDAFLAEVRASAIDSLVDIKTKQLADMHPDTHAFGATSMSIRSQINELQVFAAQLRQEAAQ